MMETKSATGDDILGFIPREHKILPWIDEMESLVVDCSQSYDADQNKQSEQPTNRQSDGPTVRQSDAASIDSFNKDRLGEKDKVGLEMRPSFGKKSRITTSELIFILLRMLVVNMGLPLLDVITDVR